MRPQTYQPTESARALGTTITAAEAVKETAVATLRLSIDRILGLMGECDDPARKRRLNDTLFLATQALSAAVRSQPRLSADH